MEGLFNILFNLQIKSANRPLEDYLTELFTYVLRLNPRLLVHFLKKFEIYQNDLDSFELSTQFEITKLPGHDMNSRPDMALFLNDAVIFFENKVASNEGIDQLPRYADHLGQYSDKKTSLVYITRDYDPKDEARVKGENNNVVFKQIRWYQVYQLIKEYESDILVAELLRFMKQNKLTMNNQFSPLDILTLTNFSSVRRILNEVLRGEIYETFKKINRGNIAQDNLMNQLRRHDRYVYYSAYEHEFQVLYGFWMNSEALDPYPEVGLVLEVGHKTSKRNDIIVEFKKVLEIEKGVWKPNDLDNPQGWGSISYKRSLQYFISEQDHVRKIKDFFLDDAFVRLENIFTKYSKLPI